MSGARLAVALVILAGAGTAIAREPPAAAPAAPDGLDAILGRPGGLVEAEVARRAAGVSPSARERGADRAAAEAAAAEARILRWPRLAAQARYTRIDETEPQAIPDLPIDVFIPGPIPDQWAAELTLSVPLSDHLLRIPHAIAASGAGAEVARWRHAAAELDAVATARLAYWDWVELRLTEVALAQGLAQAREHLALVEVAVLAGAAADADALAVRAQVASVELRLARVRSGVALVAERLGLLVGTAPPTEIGETLAGSPDAAPDAPTSADALLDEARRRRPELRALAAGDRAIAGQAELARAGYWPRLDALAHGALVNPNPRGFPQEEAWATLWDLSVVASFTLNDVPAARQQVRAAQARRHALAAQRSALEDGLRLQALQASRASSDAGVALRTSADAVRSTDEALRVRTLLFQQGRATSSELTDAETAQLAARLEHVGARVALRRARVLVDQATGQGLSRR